MVKFVAKRLLAMIPVLIGITLFIFAILSVVPGNPARLVLGVDATQEEVIALEEEMGLNDPFFTRYLNYMGGVLKGDFGTSWVHRYDVGEEIMSRMPLTMTIALGAMVMQIVFGLPIGIISAVKQYSTLDMVITAFAMALTSAPSFWLGLILMLVFALKLGWLPAIGAASWPGYILPTITLASGIMAGMIRTTRSNMLESIRQDYVRTARAKGAPEKMVIFRDVLPNALMPIVTLVGMNFGQNLSGAIVTETVFALPGIGTLMYQAVFSRDMPVTMGCIIFMAICICAVNLIVDMLYAYIDPRVKSQYLAAAGGGKRK